MASPVDDVLQRPETSELIDMLLVWLPGSALGVALAIALHRGGLGWVRFRRAPPREAPLWGEVDLLLCFAAYFLGALIAAGVPVPDGLSPAGGFLLQQIVWSAIYLAFVVAIIRYRSGQSLSSLGLVAAPVRNVVPVLLLLVFMMLPVIHLSTGSLLLFRLFGVPVAPQAPVEAFTEALQAGDVTSLVLLALAAVVLAPLGEEILFRGFLFGALRARWGQTAAVIVSSLVFALMHWTPVIVAPLFLVGALLAYVYLRTGSLLFAILFHALFNATQLATMFLSQGGGEGSP